ncbi:MAG: NAD(P)H-hydrate dehydratase [Candidatus Marinimicrobia bacterium]|nr:NAD(P)H-hydrate dehydratase [Candidatus Neomarinimicrobiota bacterium]
MNKNTILTSQDAQQVDKTAMGELGIAGEKLMKKAGGFAGENAFKIMQEKGITKCQIFSGKGNNGGDGFVTAYELFQRGKEVEVFIVPKKDEIKGDAKFHFDKILELGIEPIHIDKLSEFEKMLDENSLWVDGLLGTGLNSELRGSLKSVIKTLVENHKNQPVVAIDIPSGIDGTNGKNRGSALKADITTTMGFYKSGNFLQDGKEYNGEVKMVDLGYPDESFKDVKNAMFLCDDAMVKKMISPIPITAHKYQIGQLVAIGGSSSMGGAITLSSLSALRSGVGMLHTIVPKSVANNLKSHSIETIVHQSKNKNYLTVDDIEIVKKLDSKTNAYLLGPGIGRDEETKKLVKSFLEFNKKPIVIDADGLFHLNPNDFLNRKFPIIITPHWGEFCRLFTIDSEELSENVLEITKRVSQKYNIIVHLKSATSITAIPSGEIFIHPTGTSGMATAGSGDVLTGIIGSFLAQGYSPKDATIISAHIHGRAGEIASEKLGNRSMIASDIIKYLPNILKEYG